MTTTEKTWKPPTWLVLQHPRPLPCQRTPCADEPHDAREHLDPRHPQYDGPDTTIRALNEGPRRAARALLDAGAPVPEIVDLVREIHFLKGQVAAVSVQADHQRIEAGKQALDCGEHGQRIAEAERQAYEAHQDADRKEKARVALLPFPQAVRELVDNMRQRQKLGHDLPTINDLLTVLDQAVKKTFAAHGRAVK